MKNLIASLQQPRRLGLAIALSSAAILSAAYISQYGFGLQPCILCLYQRIPYALNISLGIFAALATLRYPRLATLLLFLAALSFLGGTLTAGFHVGVEQGWWKGLPACGNTALPENASIEQLRDFLRNQAIVRCDKPAWTLFGVSMAGYNFLMSLGLTFASFFLLRGKRAA